MSITTRARRHLALLAAGAAVLLVAGAGLSNVAPPDIVLAADNPVVLMAAGDIAEGGTSTMANATATGDLIRAANPDDVLTLGDDAYPDGSASDFATRYDPTWGSFKAKTKPAPGNHEYHANPPTGYLGYFGQANVTTNNSSSQVWYAWDVGNGWRAYSLNATGSVSTSAGSAQEAWLRADLAANPGMHYLAYLHFPRYNSGTIHGQDSSQCPLWADLLAAKADLVLAGHDHSYERWDKQDCSGHASATGIREIKVGSGGNQLYPFGSAPANLQARNNTDYGVLRLVLHRDSYEWAFIGSGRCWNGSTSADCPADTGKVLDSGTTPTNVAGSTATATPTQTRTGTPTQTVTPTRTVTPIVAPTLTPILTPTVVPTSPSPPSGATHHYVSNEGGAYATTSALGFNVHDTGMSASAVNGLPAGNQAMVWASNGKCPSSLSSTFTSFVSAQASNPKVYGYYLVDEPDNPASSCVAGIRAMADYIHANAPGKEAFIELTDYPGTYAAYAPARSHADLVGLDPYPCRRDASACDFADIGAQVTAAVGAGIPRSAMVPTYQAFGDGTWRPPTAAELQAILTEWVEADPTPTMDYAYSWGCQDGSLTDCLSGSTAWQGVLKAWFAGASQPTVTPSVTPVPTVTRSPVATPTPTVRATPTKKRHHPPRPHP
jgi:hypothetical protein